MRYSPIDNQLFIQNRQRLTALLKPNSMVVVNANDIMPTNADGTMAFRQNNDLFYLTGVDQEETRLVLFPDHPDLKFREVLFLRETSELIELWEGHKLTKAEAEQVTEPASCLVYRYREEPDGPANDPDIDLDKHCQLSQMG